jgi:4-carboxymuconolactone decarboxylase
MTDRFPGGLEVRKKVLGEAYVERSLGNATTFSMPMQEFATESCWGTAWTRPGLPRKTRSLLCITLLTALNRQHELGLHVAAALDNDCTVAEIQEVLLHAATYCGVPAGIEAFRTAEKALKERGVDLDSL